MAAPGHRCPLGRDSQSSWSSSAPSPEPALQELTHFSLLLVLSALLKPSPGSVLAGWALCVCSASVSPPLPGTARGEVAERRRERGRVLQGGGSLCLGGTQPSFLQIRPKNCCSFPRGSTSGSRPSLLSLGIPGNLCAIPLPGLA